MDIGILNKKKNIRPCIHQIQSYFGKDSISFRENQMRLDASLLIMERVFKQFNSLTTHPERIRKLSFTKTSEEPFQLLHNKRLIKLAITTSGRLSQYRSPRLPEDFSDSSKIAITLIPE